MVMEATARGEARRQRMLEKKVKKKRKPQTDASIAGPKIKKRKFKKGRPLTDAELQRFASDGDSSEASEGERVGGEELAMKKMKPGPGRNGEASFSEKLWSETKKRNKEDAAAKGLDVTAFESGSEGEGAAERSGELAEAAAIAEEDASVSHESEDEASPGEDGDEGEDATKEDAFARAFSRMLDDKIAEDEPAPILPRRVRALAKKSAEEEAAREARKEARLKKLELKEKCHVLPKTHTDVKEKDLLKTATKGVVQLFNAVTKAQKAQAASPWMRGQGGRTAARDAEKQSRAAFLAELRGVVMSASTSAAAAAPEAATGAAPGPALIPSKGTGDASAGWEVLRDDFMLGRAKLKDWDKAKANGGNDEPMHENSDGQDDDDEF